jgi:probable phosphomutase (TIGR03848 family)
MSTVLLVRHGLTELTGRVLTGRSPGLHLDDRGRAQAAAVAGQIAVLPLAAVVSSPMERCLETAEAILAAQRSAGHPPERHIDERLTECDYGEWTGRGIQDLAKESLWRTVQTHPSAARFPGGESLAEVSARAVAGVRDWDVRLGSAAVWVVCSHGDPIKAVIADALGLHLDQFQRIVVDPCSVSAIQYTTARPLVVRSNDVGGDLAALAPVARRRGARNRPSDGEPNRN